MRHPQTSQPFINHWRSRVARLQPQLHPSPANHEDEDKDEYGTQFPAAAITGSDITEATTPPPSPPSKGGNYVACRNIFLFFGGFIILFCAVHIFLFFCLFFVF
jgi:hypothetical protein